MWFLHFERWPLGTPHCRPLTCGHGHRGKVEAITHDVYIAIYPIMNEVSKALSELCCRCSQLNRASGLVARKPEPVDNALHQYP